MLRTLAIAVFCIGCLRSTVQFSGASPTRALAYPQNPLVLTRNSPATPDTPTYAGSAPNRFIVSAPLPQGLLIDGATGIVSGTPLVITAATTYTVIASGDSGDTEVALSIQVNEAPPALAFVDSPYTFVIGELSTSGLPLNTGGPYTGCKYSSGTLPSGMGVGNDCLVSGFPLAPQAPTTLVLDVDYAAGALTVPLSIQVNNPLAIVPPRVDLPGQAGQTVQFSANGGHPPYTFSVVGATTGIVANATGALYTSSASDQQVQVADSEGHTVLCSVFNRHTWVNGPVNAIASDVNATTQTDAVYLGGEFDRADFALAPNLFAVDTLTAAPRFELDTQAGFDGAVTSIVSDGTSLYAAGLFHNYRGQPAHGLAKINLISGDLDTTFTQITGIESAAQPWALLLIGGELLVGVFGSDTGILYRDTVIKEFVWQLDPQSGGLLGTLPVGAGGDSSGGARALLQVGGNVVVAGQLKVNATSCGMAALSLDGAVLWQADTVVLHGELNALASNASGIFGAGHDGFFAVDASGTALPAFTDANLKGLTAVAASDTAVYLGGSFSNITGAASRSVLALSADGSALATSDFNANATLDGSVTLLSMQNGELLVGGGANGAVRAFSHCAGQLSGALAKLDADEGTCDSTFAAGNGFDGIITATDGDQPISVLSVASAGEQLIVAGFFAAYQGVSVGNVARFDAVADAFDANFAANALLGSPSNDMAVEALAVGGAWLYAGGTFAPNGDATPLGAARLDLSSGAIDTSFTSSTVGFTGEVDALFFDSPGNELWVGGSFTAYQNNTDVVGFVDIDLATTGFPSKGAAYFSFATTSGAPVIRTLAQVDGLVMASGTFTSYNWYPNPLCAPHVFCVPTKTPETGFANVAIFDPYSGAPDADPSPVMGVAGNVVNASLEDLAGNGDLLFGGTFASSFAQIQDESNLVVTPTGYLQPQFGPTTAVGINALAAVTTTQPKLLFAGGNFTQSGDTGLPFLARLVSVSGTNSDDDSYPAYALDRTFNAAPNVDGPVNALLFSQDGRLYIGGSFAHYQGASANNLVIIEPVSGLQIE